MNFHIVIKIITHWADGSVTNYYAPASDELTRFLQKSFRTLFVPDGMIQDKDIMLSFFRAFGAKKLEAEKPGHKEEWIALYRAWRAMCLDAPTEVYWTRMPTTENVPF